jgi:hypothetical protein
MTLLLQEVTKLNNFNGSELHAPAADGASSRHFARTSVDSYRRERRARARLKAESV